MSSAKPAARIDDNVVKGKIVTGSATVLIGDRGEGQADQCPTCEPTVGGPVNPILGVKLLPAETDFALAAPLPFAFSRGYLSSNARIGVLGQGWSIPGDGVGLEVDETATVLIDAQGRRIRFSPLAPGEALFSPSERLWIRRGGPAPDPKNEEPPRWSGRWAAVPEALQDDEAAILVLSGAQYLHFAPVHGAWRLRALFDRNGYRTEFGWGEEGVPTRVRDSAGRLYALVYQRFCNPTDTDRGMRLQGVVLAAPAGDLQRTPRPVDPSSPDNDWLVRYEYSAAGDLVAVRDRAHQVVRTFQWTDHRLIAHAQPGGIEIKYLWDEQGRVSRQSETGGLSRIYGYHADCTELLDSLGRSETYHFAGEGGERRWTGHTRADKSEVAYQYDGAGRRTTVLDPLERRYHTQLDSEGRVTATTAPGRVNWRYTLDPDTGGALSITDPDSRTWRFTRDARGNPCQITAPDGGQTRYAYADSRLPDRPTQITDAAGRTKHLTWNALGQLTSYTDCSGQRSSWDYDGDGRQSRHTDAAGRSTAYRYDKPGRLIEVQLPDGGRMTYTYDTLGRRTSVTDPAGGVTRFDHDRFGRLTGVMDAAGRTQRYRYDAAGRLIELENENEAKTRFAYDKLDRLIEETGFDGRSRRYRYNLAGELVEIEEADGRVTAIDYDAAGRVAARHLPATEAAPALTETFTWSPGGQLIAAASPAGTIHRHYDTAGRLQRELQHQPEGRMPLDGWTYAVSHQHNVLGVLETSTFGDAPPIDWLTYGPGHLHGVRVGELALDLERDALHREVLRRAMGEDSTATFETTRAYDRTGRLATTLHEPLVGDPWQRRYRYDPLGQLATIEEDDTPVIAYTYDPTGRLIASRHGTGKHGYRFDPAGNRLDPEHIAQAAHQDWAQTVRQRLNDPDFSPLGIYDGPGARARTHWPDNRITELDGGRYRYDAAGNLTEKLTADGTRLTLAYDGAHRLVHLSREAPDGTRTEAHYHYDALSRRIKKTVRHGERETTTRYGWDGDRLATEALDDRLRTTVYEPGSFVPLLRIDQDFSDTNPQELRDRRQLAAVGLLTPEAAGPIEDFLRTPPKQDIACYHTDHLGTPLRLTDTQGKTIWQAEPHDWAAVRGEHGETDQSIRFQGQWWDEESGLYYNRYRYYDPGLGRYVSQDPIGLMGGLHVYNYPTNPTKRVDPLGLDHAMTSQHGPQITTFQDGKPTGTYYPYADFDTLGARESAKRLEDALRPGGGGVGYDGLGTGAKFGEPCKKEEIGVGKFSFMNKLLQKIHPNLGVSGSPACLDPGAALEGGAGVIVDEVQKIPAAQILTPSNQATRIDSAVDGATQ